MALSVYPPLPSPSPRSLPPPLSTRLATPPSSWRHRACHDLEVRLLRPTPSPLVWALPMQVPLRHVRVEPTLVLPPQPHPYPSRTPPPPSPPPRPVQPRLRHVPVRPRGGQVVLEVALVVGQRAHQRRGGGVQRVAQRNLRQGRHCAATSEQQPAVSGENHTVCTRGPMRVGRGGARSQPPANRLPALSAWLGARCDVGRSASSSLRRDRCAVPE